jgi:hypothetical protein
MRAATISGMTEIIIAKTPHEVQVSGSKKAIQFSESEGFLTNSL